MKFFTLPKKSLHLSTRSSSAPIISSFLHPLSIWSALSSLVSLTVTTSNGRCSSLIAHIVAVESTSNYFPSQHCCAITVPHPRPSSLHLNSTRSVLPSLASPTVFQVKAGTLLIISVLVLISTANNVSVAFSLL